MTTQLGWVLVGVTVAVAIVAIALVALVSRARRSDSPRARADGPRSSNAALTAATAAAAMPSAGQAAGSESPELRSARLAAQQALLALAFSAPLAPAPGAVRPRGAAATGPAATDAGAAAVMPTHSDAAHESALEAIRRTLIDVVDRPNYAPRRPLLLPKLMQAMNDSDTSRRELATIIATDPALTGSLLRLANSPFYRLQPEPVESLDRAIALLGLEGMRSLIASALMQPVFRISGGMFLQFGEITWEHTLYSGAAAESHAAVIENADPFAAQLLALIMGLSTIVVFRVATDEYLTRKLRPNPSEVGALIDLESAPVGRRIAASWELSERMDQALAEQSALTEVPASALGRSLQLGRFIGAVTLLHAHGVMDEEQVTAALKSGGPRGEAYVRIWSRLAAARASA